MKTIKEDRTTLKKRFFAIDFHAFWVLVKMLLANSLSLDIKHNKKKAIIKLILSVVIFAAIAALSYIFFYFCIRFNIFSLLAYVPMEVPSIIVSLMLIFSFLSSIGKVTEDLYFSNDNKVLLTFPTSGNTLFLARLGVSFISAYIKSLLLEIPFLFGYFLISGYPIYMYILLFPIWALIDIALLLLASLISIPTYYVKKYLRTHSFAKIIASAIFILVLLGLCVFIITIIPTNIDIYSNWGTYFAKIQEGLLFYRNSMSFFYKASMLYLGSYSGFSFAYFYKSGIAGLYAFLIVLAAIFVFYFASLALANPLYLKLASQTGELQPKSKKQEKGKQLRASSPFKAQLKKEAILFFKDSSLSSSYIDVFLGMPLLIALLAKLFSAMDLNTRGDSLVQVACLLIALLLSLSANGTISKIYSQEGGAFKLGRTYPLKESAIITSKILIPSFIGTISFAASIIALCVIRPSMVEGTILMGIGAFLAYLGHLLYSAGLDFTNPKSNFGDTSLFANNEVRSTILAFATAAIFAALYYLYFQDHILWLESIASTSGLKVLILGIIYLALNLILYVRKIKYIYKTGENL